MSQEPAYVAVDTPGGVRRADEQVQLAVVHDVGVLVVLAVAILAVPHEVPTFVVPGSPASLQMMKAMR
jgi:hypothetical protein